MFETTLSNLKMQPALNARLAYTLLFWPEAPLHLLRNKTKFKFSHIYLLTFSYITPKLTKYIQAHFLTE